MAELKPLLEHATELLGLKPHREQGLLQRVRRFPAPDTPGRERFGPADENPLSHVDRVEAIEAVYELFSVPHQRRSAASGGVLPDVGLLSYLLDELGRRPGFPRGALIVGLGLLGDPVSFERAVPDGSIMTPRRRRRSRLCFMDWEDAEEILDMLGREEDPVGAGPPDARDRSAASA